MADAQGIEDHPNVHVQVHFNGKKIADSSDVIKLEEDGHPVRYYIPRADVEMQYLEPSDTVTECPFKGEASYFSINIDGHEMKDAVWSYESPYEEHSDIKGMLAFYDDKVDKIEVSEAA